MKLDSIRNLKKTFEELRARIGRAPSLLDFARFDVADPVVVAGARGNYWNLLTAIKAADKKPSEAENAALTYATREFLNGKRPHELLLLRRLVEAPDQRITVDDFVEELKDADLSHSEAEIASVRRIADLSFFTEGERKKYFEPIISWTDKGISLAPGVAKEVKSGGLFAEQLSDVIDTGLYLARHRYAWSADLEVGKKYSRKDVCRLLNWKSNQQGTMYGYKVDEFSSTCPIFVTYHKHDDVSASTSYEDSFVNESVLHWFTRSNRTLESAEVRAIAANKVPLYLFAKKDDAEGTDFYFLGRARSSNAEQTTMPGSDGQSLNVVTMDLTLDVPVETALFDYLVTSSSIHSVIDSGDTPKHIDQSGTAKTEIPN